MEVILGQGFDNIRFGMRESEIVAVLGSPDKRFESDGILHLIYFSIKCELWISKEHKRLDWIESSNSQAHIFGKLAIGENKHQLISFLDSRLDDSLGMDDLGLLEYYDYDKTLLSLSFEFDVLTLFGFGAFVSDDGVSESNMQHRANAHKGA